MIVNVFKLHLSRLLKHADCAVKFKLTKIALTYICEDVTYFQMYHSLIFLYAICQANKIY